MSENTHRTRILAAAENVEKRRAELAAAETVLLDTILTALDAGASLRTIAPLIGASHSTLHRRLGKGRARGADVLDQEAARV